jgi:hypothetical protein
LASAVRASSRRSAGGRLLRGHRENFTGQL